MFKSILFVVIFLGSSSVYSRGNSEAREARREAMKSMSQEERVEIRKKRMAQNKIKFENASDEKKEEILARKEKRKERRAAKRSTSSSDD